MNNAEEKIAFLVAYYSTRRGVGHTLALTQGLIRTDDVVVIVADLDDKRYMEQQTGKKLKTVLLDDMHMGLRGSYSPLIISDHATTVLLHGILETLKEYRSEVYEWKDRYSRAVENQERKTNEN